ncbi:hypothetical protein [Rubrivirga sp. IMCC43871]|uniref:hypothetical protein n=1 Tax=Rubrivirga sp. IMCC43871 TaxID=3391575 RepID=UPI00398FE4F2
MTRFRFRSPALVLGALLALTACDAVGDTAGPDLTDAEVAEATEILAEALAEDGGGLTASVRDMTSSLSPDSLRDGPRGVRGHRRHDRPPCRAEVELTYDPGSGTHTVAYACSAETDFGFVRYASELLYQFRDATGGFIPEPAANWPTVDAVTFGGTRSGVVERVRGDHSQTSTFEQDGTWALTALADDAAPAMLEGRQERTGTRTRTGPDGTASRSYHVVLSGSGIEVREGPDGLGHAAVGQLVYTLTLEVTRNGEAETRVVEGTVELEENGRALLRLIGIRGVYRVSLGDGLTDRASDRPGSV